MYETPCNDDATPRRVSIDGQLKRQKDSVSFFTFTSTFHYRSDKGKRPAEHSTSAKMLAVASGLFGKSSTLSAYTLHSSTPTASPSSSSTNLPSLAGSASKGFSVGLWRVVGATHKTTNKDVSVWVFEKKVLEGVRGATQPREWALDQLKKEVCPVFLRRL
jgi:hypothetical protein